MFFPSAVWLKASKEYQMALKLHLKSSFIQRHEASIRCLSSNDLKAVGTQLLQSSQEQESYTECFEKQVNKKKTTTQFYCVHSIKTQTNRYKQGSCSCKTTHPKTLKSFERFFSKSICKKWCKTSSKNVSKVKNVPSIKAHFRPSPSQNRI